IYTLPLHDALPISEAFLAALLNSQPMGFYAPAQLIQDARRHGVQVLPVDITVSHWEATLEPPHGQDASDHANAHLDTASSDPHARCAAARPAVRLGLNQIKSLTQGVARRIEQARAVRPFSNTQDLARRADLNRHALDALAAADAL